MRRSTHAAHRLTKKIPAGIIKQAYRQSVKKIRRNPGRSISAVTLGVGLLSGLYMLFRLRNH